MELNKPPKPTTEKEKPKLTINVEKPRETDPPANLITPEIERKRRERRFAYTKEDVNT